MQQNSTNTYSAGPYNISPKKSMDDSQVSTPSYDASWGDSFKRSAFNSGTYVGINYFLNTIGSVAIAYQFEIRYDQKLKDFSHNVGKGIAKITGLNAAKEGQAFYAGARGLTLTMGGTVLIPVLKTLEDHRHAIEFRIGHGLDVAQNALGMSNQATKENLQEYHAIKTAVKTGKPIQGVSPEAMKLIGKQHDLTIDCDGKVSFNEHKTPWSHMIIARAAAWGAAFGTNNLLARIGLDKALTASQDKVTEAITSVIPAYSKMKDPNVFSKNLANDAVLCISSSVTQPFAQRLLRNKQSRHAMADRQDCYDGTSPQAPAQPPGDAQKEWAKNKTDIVASDGTSNAAWAKERMDKIVANVPAPAQSHQAAESRRTTTQQQTSMA